jgi:hypothetical protein
MRTALIELLCIVRPSQGRTAKLAAGGPHLSGGHADFARCSIVGSTRLGGERLVSSSVPGSRYEKTSLRSWRPVSLGWMQPG